MTRVKKLLLQKGLQAREFNRRLGISDATVYRFTNRRGVLPRHWHKRIAKMLGASIDEIIGCDGFAVLDDEKISE